METNSSRKHVITIFVIITLAFLTVFLLQRLGNDTMEGAVHIMARKVETRMEQQRIKVHKIPEMNPVDCRNLEEKEQRMQPFVEKEGR